MKNIPVFFACMLLLCAFAVSCDRSEVTIEPATRAGVEDAMPEISTRSLEGAVYNEVTDTWMIPQKDPFTLENFQKAYDILSAGKSARTLTRAQAAEFVASKKLKPTHYALKIYPRNEEEQWRVETMDDVQVAYIPFCYAQLTREEIERLPQAKAAEAGKKVAATSTFAEKSPYTVTYDDMVSSDGGPIESVTFQLPILYTVWPVGKPLPNDLEYVVDYEVFLPHTIPGISMSEEATQTLAGEAIAFAMGISTQIEAPLKALKLQTVSGIINTYDNKLGVNVPLVNLGVRFAYGSYMEAFSMGTDSSGYFKLLIAYVLIGPSSPLRLSVVYGDLSGKWKITPENSLIPYMVNVNVDSIIDTEELEGDYFAGQITLTSTARQENEIHRATNYFFNNQTAFPKNVPSGGLKIMAYSTGTGNSSYEGALAYSPTSCHINIYNNGRSDSHVIGTTLHELGHFAHFRTVGFYPYIDTHPFLRESFASYSGWYLGEAHYTSVGWSRPAGYSDITGQARQEWQETFGILYITGDPNIGYYSPLFIDMTDDFNQAVYFNSGAYPNDGIRDIPASAIWNIITTCTTWFGSDQCLSKILSYDQGGQMNNWIFDFIWWFENE